MNSNLQQREKLKKIYKGKKIFKHSTVETRTEYKITLDFNEHIYFDNMKEAKQWIDENFGNKERKVA